MESSPLKLKQQKKSDTLLSSTLIRRVCSRVSNLPPSSGVENPKSMPCSGAKSVNHISCSGVTTPSLNQMYCIVLYCIVLYCIVLYCIVLYCIVLYCIVLETKTIFMLYLFMMLPFHFSSTMFARKSIKFSIIAISSSYDKCSAFQN